MDESITDWRNRVKDRIRQKYPPGACYDDEAERRFKAVMGIPVPTDDELIAMQERGELPSDDDLAGDG